MWDQVPFQLHRGLTLFLVESGHQEAQIRDGACLLPEPQPEAMCRQGSGWDEQAGGSDCLLDHSLSTYKMEWHLLT